MKKKTRKHAQIQFYRTIVETLTTTKKGGNRIQAQEIVKGCTRLDRIRTELSILGITKIRIKV